MKTLLICHEGAKLDQQGLVRWLASFSTLVGIVVLRETLQTYWRRVQREIRRVGIIQFIDVIAFRIYYKLLLLDQDRLWEAQKLEELSRIYPKVSENVPVLYSPSPNTVEVEQFIKKLSPDIMLARCKTLLRENIFSLPSRGTFALHPGICPEYRNAHGCFWALANDDLDNVGMTLLRIDKGIDTGPIYGHYRYKYDEVDESHIRIQQRVVYENLSEVQTKLLEICNGIAVSLDVSGRSSAVWGQVRLTIYLKWKYRARRRNR